MSYESIKICRDKNGYSVSVTDPEIVKKNDSRKNGVGEWKDPCIEYNFDTKSQVLVFVEKAFDIALPASGDYSTTFDAAAKAAMKTE